MTSTDEPVGHTCRTIDYIIRQINYAIGELKGIDGTNDVISYLNVEDELEDVRSANDKLRKWGNDLAEEVLESRDKFKQLRDKFNQISEIL